MEEAIEKHVADIKHIVNMMIVSAHEGGYPKKTMPKYEKFCKMLDELAKVKYGKE